MSVTGTIEKDLGKAAHDIAVGAEKVKAAVVDVAQTLAKDAPSIAQAETLAEGVAEKLSPGAEAVVAAIIAVAGKIFAAVDAAGAAASANGLSVTLDTALIQSVQAALPAVKAQASAAAPAS